MTYIIAYFIVNFIIAGKMIHNVYFVPHPPEEEQEMKEEIGLFIPATILFGTIFIVMEYYFRSMEGD